MRRCKIKVVSVHNEKTGQDEQFVEMHSSLGDFWRVGVADDPILLLQVQQETNDLRNIREYIKMNGKHYHKDGTPFKDINNLRK